ncbi:exodeoxyribonuclease V subunit beta [Candidatus Marithioploca araucensis]|uniref:RecBCD enzyme subunit RecB n=1 Tax=Candidatus Marithioploca araucensis TaxID=70273 RepID=A0ABT7VQS9_9GAMM|nr:exodeoxyribonuclease V subunit beta [Candidatus Marithioploca araucensis]
MNPQTIEKLEPLAAPLQGTNLIEASAGTGKTYTMTTLVIRLILEKNLTIDQILVVTFTEAATEELRDRIRRRLREALTAFQQGGYPDDDVLAELMRQCSDHKEAIFHLTNALRGFDQAAIFTIHSFCRQMLQDNAFESGILFDAELVSDQSHLLREIVEDFWRQHFYQTSQLFITYALEKRFNHPASLLRILRHGQYVGQPFLRIIPKQDAPMTEAKELAFYTAFTETQRVWQSESAEIEELLLNDKGLNGNKYRKKSIPQWCKTVDHFLNALKMSITLPEKWIKFTPSELARSVKKNKLPPEHVFFDCCEKLLDCQQALSECYQEKLLALKIELFQMAEQALADKKQQHHIQSFDDLLINLHKALKGKNADNLALMIRKKYPAALIDEFQDTDPVQYEIFRIIYGDGNRTLFLIGDPKQAIYSFRGADIFTYINACHDAKHRYTLATNWRSEPALIGGVNKLFEKTECPFIFKDIPFQPVQAPAFSERKEENIRLKIENKFLPPLQFWFVSRGMAECALDKPINKEWARQQIPISVAHEIARLLVLGQQEQAVIGDKPLVAGDIAVLVRTNTQAQQMQKVLSQLQIPSVLYSRESLLTSYEMMEIERVLVAVADYNNEALIKAALTTEMLGVSGTELHHLMENDREWQERLNRFQYYHFLWRNIGFIQMYRTLLLKEQIQLRLLSRPDGERRLTNVLHAAEMLQQAAVQQKLGVSGLCQWLSRQRHKETTAEEEQLRLESDEKRVKIVTIHKSKGLEYPIVFCPFVWDGYLHNHKAEQFTFHNEEDELTLDLGSFKQEEHRELALEEERAENLRLFYVAVTRAKHRCYLIWGAFRDAKTSALAYLLHPGETDVENIDDTTLWQNLQRFADQTNVQVSHCPIDKTPYHRPIETAEQLKPRPFFGKIDKTWKVSSFTSLSASTIETTDRPDHDETIRFSIQEKPNTNENNIFTFPRGARTGSCMHGLFENLDFKTPESQLPDFIKAQLQNFGYAEKWQNAITTLVKHVLTTSLEPQQDLTLSALTFDKRLNELEFYYPLSHITPSGLRAVFAKFGHQNLTHFTEEMNRLTFYPVRGFMKGYIDMVFEYKGRYYLVDYKSNMLGIHQENYHYTHLNGEMARAGYILQYHIYVVALHRYLSTRLPGYRYDAHFGGVYYLFLRGMNSDWGAHYGIYRDKPSAALIKELSAYFGKILESKALALE